jgi:hypothetical protein
MARRSVKSPEENVLALRTDSLAPEGTGRQLYDAVYNKQLDQVRTLCERWAGHGEVISWANPYTGDTPLHAARDSPQCATILLSTPGIDVNKGDRHGWTPLFYAAYFGNPKTAKALLAAPGIDINKAATGEGLEGKSPLTIAREMATAGKLWEDSEKEAAERRKACQEVVRLLEAAEAKPSKGGKIKTRKNKRSKKNKRKTSNLYRRRI